MNAKTRYKKYITLHRTEIKHYIYRIMVLNKVFCWSDSDLSEYDLILKTIGFECKVFNMLFNKHITLRTYLNMFGY